MEMDNNFQISNLMINDNNFIINNSEDEEFLRGFILGFQEEINKVVPKMNVIFENTKGKKENIIVYFGTTIDELLKIYLKRINRMDLIKDSYKITFSANARFLKFGDITLVEHFFHNEINPKVVVNETPDSFFLGPKYTFITTNGYIKNYVGVPFNLSIETFLDIYLKEVGKRELNKKDKIFFFMEK